MLIGRIPVLDGWRTLSVGLVVMAHLAYRSGLADSLTHWKVLIYPYGGLGVQIFFFISGFVIANGLLAEKARTGSISLLGFYVRRAFRILPPLFLYLVVVAFLSYHALLPIGPLDFIKVLSFTCNLSPCGSSVAHTWSLAYEEQFYLVFPWLFLLLSKGAWRFAALYVLLAAATLALPGRAADNFLIPFGVIALGVAAAATTEELRALFARVPAYLVPLSLAALLAFATLQQKFNIWFGEDVLLWSDVLIKYPLMAFTLLGSIFQPNNILTRIFSVGSVALVGRASYAIYLWQQLATENFGVSSPWFYVATVSALVPVSLLQFLYFEQPLLRLGARLSAKWKTDSVRASGAGEAETAEASLIFAEPAKQGL
jgi:peptidoglycan/LPS O-acetylase OafA/YrhL